MQDAPKSQSSSNEPLAKPSAKLSTQPWRFSNLVFFLDSASHRNEASHCAVSYCFIAGAGTDPKNRMLILRGKSKDTISCWSHDASEGLCAMRCRTSAASLARASEVTTGRSKSRRRQGFLGSH